MKLRSTLVAVTAGSILTLSAIALPTTASACVPAKWCWDSSNMAATVAVADTSQAKPGAATSTLSTAPTYYGCPPRYLCLYKGVNYNKGYGRPNAMYYHCGIVNINGWTAHGSYFDNQTAGTLSVFYSGDNGTGRALRSFRAIAQVPDYDFYPLNSIKVC